MNSKLSAYIDTLFASAPQTDKARELKEEMLQNLNDKYNDLIAEGKSEDEAYRIAVSGIGDVSALIGGRATDAAPAQDIKAAGPVRSRNGLITAAAVVLYVLSVIPILLVADVLGILLMFDMVAVATGLLILDAPRRERPSASIIAAAVMLYIICATPCIALNSLLGVIFLFVLIAIATALLVYNGCQQDALTAAHAGGVDVPAEQKERVQKTLSLIGKVAIALALAVMIALLVVGGAENRRVHYYIADEIEIDDFDEDWDDLQQGEEHRTPRQGDASTKPAGATAGTAELIGSASVPVTGIKEIEIDWVSGNVHIEAGSGDEIQFAESSTRTLTEREKLRYRVHGGELTISYCASTWSAWDWLDLDRLGMPSKDLTLIIPASLVGQFRDLEVNGVSAAIESVGVYAQKTAFETVSGDIWASGIAGEKLDAQSTSGAITLEECSVRELDIETVSGNAEMAGSADNVELQTVSGTISAALAAEPTKLETEAVSGDISIALPQTAGNFSARFETVSGDFTCAFPTLLTNSRYVAGTGGAEFDFSSVSGDIRILSK